jgi:hypothetical protein
MKQYCIDCGAPLPNAWPWTIANQGGRCAACDDAQWKLDDAEGWTRMGQQRCQRRTEHWRGMLVGAGHNPPHGVILYSLTLIRGALVVQLPSRNRKYPARHREGRNS